MDQPRCKCGSYARKPGRGCNKCDPVSAEEKKLDAEQRQRDEREACESSVKTLVDAWKRGDYAVINPTTMRVGVHNNVSFYECDGGCVGDLTTEDYPQLKEMFADLRKKFAAKLWAIKQ